MRGHALKVHDTLWPIAANMTWTSFLHTLCRRSSNKARNPRKQCENCQIHASRLCCNLCILRALRAQIFCGWITILHDQSQNGRDMRQETGQIDQLHVSY